MQIRCFLQPLHLLPRHSQTPVGGLLIQYIASASDCSTPLPCSYIIPRPCCESLLRGHLPPAGRFNHGLLHTLAPPVHPPKIVLRLRQTLVRSFPEPVRHLGIRLRDALALVVHHLEVELRIDRTFLHIFSDGAVFGSVKEGHCYHHRNMISI